MGGGENYKIAVLHRAAKQKRRRMLVNFEMEGDRA